MSVEYTVRLPNGDRVNIAAIGMVGVTPKYNVIVKTSFGQILSIISCPSRDIANNTHTELLRLLDLAERGEVAQPNFDFWPDAATQASKK